MESVGLARSASAPRAYQFDREPRCLQYFVSIKFPKFVGGYESTFHRKKKKTLRKNHDAIFAGNALYRKCIIVRLEVALCIVRTEFLSLL